MAELTVGSSAPDFNLLASTGGTISLSGFRNKSAVYLFFIREFE